MALQQPGTTVPIPQLTIPQSTSLNPVTLVQWALNWLLWIGGVIAIGFLIYGGIMFITSGGDSEKTTKARNTILYSVVGIIIIVAAWAIVYWASHLFA